MADDIEEKNSEENKKDKENTMSDKEKLVDGQTSESSGQSEDGRPEKKKSAGSKSKQEQAKSEDKSSKDEDPKSSEDKSDLEEETNEQEEFLKKQEKLLEHVSNIEKEQSVQSQLRPCKSCELLKPFPRQEYCCASLCPFLRRRAVPKLFWIVSVPGDPRPQEAFDKLKGKTEAKKLSLNYKFHIPELKVGTLDELMYLTEELKTLDDYTQDIIHRFIEFVREVLEGTENLHQFFEVNGMDVATYITRFTWNPAKYAVKKPLSVLHDLLRAEIRRLSENLKARMDDFHELDRSLDKIEKQQTGSLLTRSLAGIVKKEHFVLDSGYLTTFLVVVPKEEEKQWLKSYHGFADMVVPNSAMKIFEDKTHMLYTVVLCKKNMEEFKNNAKQQKFIVRDFEFREEELAEEKDVRKKLRNLKKAQIAILRRWIKVNFSEGFAAWMHIKAMRVLVESVLRFGLPSNFQAMILIPLKDKEQLKNIIDEMYGNLDNELCSGTAQDVPGTLTAYGVTEYDPYVFLKIKFDAKLVKKKVES
ncbi:V-type proton ATPase subunit C 1-B [Araneus ventricosus]|uniref:V-type proton ATPase subunit C n=1 Tax=Araneus ventricosus TaxID=182803 RepID=A0A4Y2FGN3_ARAVE|nr:V-type proton ATPase subunit C 1-B [Araneus ventricosus]